MHNMVSDRWVMHGVCVVYALETSFGHVTNPRNRHFVTRLLHGCYAAVTRLLRGVTSARLRGCHAVQPPSNLSDYTMEPKSGYYTG